MIWDNFIHKRGWGHFSTHLYGKKNLEYGHNLTVSRLKIIFAGEIAYKREFVILFLKPSLAAPKIEVSNDKIEFFNHPVETD